MLNAKRLISVGLSVLVLFNQCVRTHATKSNMWEERRQANAHPLPDPRVQLAALIPPPARISENFKTAPHPSAVISPSNATLQETFTSGNPGGPSVILLEDVHRNVEAQSNIARVLQTL